MIKYLVVFAVMVSSLMASDTYKAVFDCANGNMKFVNSRMWLIEETAKELSAKKTDYEFVLTIHSQCTQIVKKSHEDKMVKMIHKRLEDLKDKYNVKIEACEIALNRWKIGKDDRLPFIDTVKNSITRVIKLQNDGFALIPYH